MKKHFKLIFLILLTFIFVSSLAAQNSIDEKSRAILKKAVEKLGGERYLQVKSLYSTGNFTQFKEGVTGLPSGFVDVIAYPDRERTEFKQMGNKMVQTNFGDKGWTFDAATQNIREQDQREVDAFKRSMRTNIDGLLRGYWRDKTESIVYAGRREAGLGKRNEVIRVVYKDGFFVEFEFSAADGMPIKALYKSEDAGETETKEEDRYAQFVDVQGVLVPFVVDHYINGSQTSRINYLTIELNKNVPDSVFTKPTDLKSLKKDLKL
jgi:outer membrane lipoprotein-sorting protein